MNSQTTQEILEQFQKGERSIDQVMDYLRKFPYESINGYVNIDHHRALRTGFPEVIFAQGKQPDQVAVIFTDLMAHNKQVLATRVSQEMYEQIKSKLSDAIYQPTAHTLYFDREPEKEKRPGIVVVSAGTSDIPVAEEAAITAQLMGNKVERLFDVGVAGLNRILDHLDLLQNANVLVVAAGMEGALPSVIGGLTSAPIIALPTSVGYGASFHGLAALLGMLNSCANGIAVVNIDNGFGAGCMAARINKLTVSQQKS
jgi:pyridinium-3,5-biscarboxylic acid mononucleotide synthase